MLAIAASHASPLMFRARWSRVISASFGPRLFAKPALAGNLLAMAANAAMDIWKRTLSAMWGRLVLVARLLFAESLDLPNDLCDPSI
jgi:hypothetical protein